MRPYARNSDDMSYGTLQLSYGV